MKTIIFCLVFTLTVIFMNTEFIQRNNWRGLLTPMEILNCEYNHLLTELNPYGILKQREVSDSG